MPGFHSLLQAGAYPDFPVLAFSQRTGKTSPRPAKRRRKSAILSADGDFFVTSGLVARFRRRTSRAGVRNTTFQRDEFFIQRPSFRRDRVEAFAYLSDSPMFVRLCHSPREVPLAIIFSDIILLPLRHWTDEIASMDDQALRHS